MNEKNRKIIGTIIGVIFFVILIAGATFAWLTYTYNADNGKYNTRALNFVVNYTNGQDINGIGQYLINVDDFRVLLYDDEYPDAARTNIVAYKTSSILEGTLYIKLHVNNNSSSRALINSGCIRYVVGVSPDGDVRGIDLSSIVNGILTSDNMDSNGDIVIYEGPLLSGSPRDGYPGYFMGFWIDKELVTGSEDGLSFSGYIYADAIQSRPSSPSSSDGR